MNIGDKVRLIHGKEEGIVRRILSGGEIEVEIEEGFRIPVLQKEVVLVSPVEAQRMVKQAPAITSSDRLPMTRFTGVFADKGIYLVFEPVNDRELSVQLINNSDWILPYTATAQKDGAGHGLGCGILEARTSAKLTELFIKDFENWPLLAIQLLFFRQGAGNAKDPMHFKLRCRANTFFNKKAKAPIINKEAYLYQLDGESGLNAGTLKEVIYDGVGKQAGSTIVEPVRDEVDLHIEKLTEIPETMRGKEIMDIQLSVFENTLEKAIASGKESITFIHGVGSGTLKNAIHKALGSHKNVSYFKDAKKDKFGYGATLVVFK